MVEGQGAIWDPLWEYVLDDYEADDVERKDRRPQKANRNPSLLDLAYIGDDESDYDHYDRRGWFEKRDDREDMDSSWGWKGRESKNEKYSKVHSWRRNQSTDVDDREDDSMWEIFVSPEEINGSFLTMESNKGNGRQKAINEKKTKKQGFLRRFRKQQEAEPNFQTSEYVNEETPKVTEMKTKDSKSVSKLNLNEGRRKPRKDKANGEVYDPFHMIFEAAEKLDPWASDSDSSQSSASDRTDHTDDDSAQTDVDANETRNEQKASGLKSAGQISVEERTPPSNFTEIRLTHMPGREGTSYDGLQPGGNSASLDGPAKLSKSRASPGQKIFDTASLATKSTCFTQASKESTKFQSILPFPAKDEEEPARPGWNRVACCSVKTHEKDGVNKLDIEDAHGVFPATRIIAKDSTEVSSILGQSADFVNGVMGIPSDKFLETKGPHSLYAYDYESNEHMDLVYSEFNQKPRSSLSVRNLGPPPALISSSSPDEVVVQVEASTVSYTDCIIRQGHWWGRDSVSLPNTPGVDVVGKIYHIKQKATSQYDLHPCQTVLSLVKRGGNTRYMSIRPEKLVKVPEGIDPAQAACLPETYLTAFQVLHYGQAGPLRYRENSLKGKSILIIGAMANNMGKAIIELALAAGAANVYATAKKKHWKTIVSYGIMPLSQDPKDWILRVEGSIDLVLATNGGLREDVSTTHYRALNPLGHLILSGRRVVGNDIDVGSWKNKHQTPLICSNALAKMMNRTHDYDVYEQWGKDLDTCKKDLAHMLKMLERGALKPNVLDRIALNKVPKAHELLESKRLSGFLVCEPWIRSKRRAVYV